jgi:hypothetical protein
VLLERLSDNNSRLRDSARDALVALAQEPEGRGALRMQATHLCRYGCSFVVCAGEQAKAKRQSLQGARMRFLAGAACSLASCLCRAVHCLAPICSGHALV